MEKIIVINDDSKESLRAAKYAFHLACRYHKHILLANLVSARRTVLSKVARSKAAPVGVELMHDEEQGPETVTDHLNCLDSGSDGFRPDIKTLDASEFSQGELINYVNSHKVWLIVHGVTVESEDRNDEICINMQSVLNQIQCPVMLIPPTSRPKKLERLVYLADLRYAQIPVINYLAKWRIEKESVVVAHICTEGLSELDKSYGDDLFNKELSRKLACKNIFFSHLYAKNFSDLIDILIHGMDADMIACMNHSYHLGQILGSKINSKIPWYISVPVLVFPY
jgi:nucleotide-binding universal stress UspA family protein